MNLLRDPFFDGEVSPQKNIFLGGGPFLSCSSSEMDYRQCSQSGSTTEVNDVMNTSFSEYCAAAIIVPPDPTPSVQEPQFYYPDEGNPIDSNDFFQGDFAQLHPPPLDYSYIKPKRKFEKRHWQPQEQVEVKQPKIKKKKKDEENPLTYVEKLKEVTVGVELLETAKECLQVAATRLEYMKKTWIQEKDTRKEKKNFVVRTFERLTRSQIKKKRAEENPLLGLIGEQLLSMVKSFAADDVPPILTPFFSPDGSTIEELLEKARAESIATLTTLIKQFTAFAAEVVEVQINEELLEVLVDHGWSLLNIVRTGLNIHRSLERLREFPELPEKPDVLVGPTKEEETAEKLRLLKLAGMNVTTSRQKNTLQNNEIKSKQNMRERKNKKNDEEARRSCDPLKDLEQAIVQRTRQGYYQLQLTRSPKRLARHTQDWYKALYRALGENNEIIRSLEPRKQPGGRPIKSFRGRGAKANNARHARQIEIDREVREIRARRLPNMCRYLCQAWRLPDNRILLDSTVFDLDLLEDICESLAEMVIYHDKLDVEEKKNNLCSSNI